MKHNILVTGGSGFVGSQVAAQLHAAGHNITIVDLVDKKPEVPGHIIVRDYHSFFFHNRIKYDTVIHLAAHHLVEQSVTEPAKYYVNNVVKMKEMLDSMVAVGIKNIIFSSSGNTYGRQGAAGIPLKEDIYYDPENPYASTKVAGEMLIKDYSKAYGINYVNFRYFNAAGADPQCRFGYTQRPATHVMPILCNKILNKQPFTIYGSDYDTIDGSCVRDYVNVADIALAHERALEFLNSGGKNETFNIGGGSSGISVKQLVGIAAEVVGVDPVIEYAGRRAGDPAMLVADISKAKQLLNWSPQYTIRDTITHAWNWENKFGKLLQQKNIEGVDEADGRWENGES
jgi:UDP-glucose 4-epimerase